MNRNKAKQSTTRRFRALHWVLAIWALGAIATSVGACNLVIESAADQCTTNTDCAKFNNGSVCVQGICVAGGSGSSGSGMGGAGPTCFSGAPTKDVEFFNQCTNATCVEFDNCARLGLCNGAALPPLVDPVAP